MPSKHNENTKEAEANAVPQVTGGAANVADFNALNPRQQAFLTAFQKCGTVKQSAEVAGIDKTTHYNWLASEWRYRALFEQIKYTVGDMLEATALEHALEGTFKPIVHQGMITDSYQEFDHVLLMKLLGRFKPEYREPKGTTNVAVQTNVSTGPEGSPHVSRADAVRNILDTDPEYLDYVRNKELAIDCDSGPLREDGERGTLEDGEASRGT